MVLDEVFWIVPVELSWVWSSMSSSTSTSGCSVVSFDVLAAGAGCEGGLDLSGLGDDMFGEALRLRRLTDLCMPCHRFGYWRKVV